MMLAFCLESETILSENAVKQKSSKVSRNSIYVCDQRATEEGGRRFENNPFLCIVSCENEDIINTELLTGIVLGITVHYFIWTNVL